MDCTPERCPHRALMERARTACLACDRGADPTDHAGMVSYEAAGERIVHRERMRMFAPEPRGQVTTLPPEVEERTKDLYRAWCQMPPVDALLALHVCNGGTPATFGEFLRRVADDIERARPAREAFRATAWAKFKSLVARFAMFDKVRTWTDGGGGAVRREREERDTPLFDVMGVRL